MYWSRVVSITFQTFQGLIVDQMLASVYLGANHFQEFAFVVDNTQGLGYGGNPNPAYPDPFAGEPPTYTALASLMSRMWVSFAHDLDPNNHGGTRRLSTLDFLV